MRRIILVLLCILAVPFAMYALDLKGTGTGTTREEARANAIYDIKSQILVEQESTTKVSHEEKGSQITDSFSVLIVEYSRDFPLEFVEFEDREDRSKPYGSQWSSIARVPGTAIPKYKQNLADLLREINTLKESLKNDTGSIKNSSLQKQLLNLSYDFVACRAIVMRLNPSESVPEIPVSLSKLRLEYEDILKKEKNDVEADFSALTLRFAYGDLDTEGLKQLEDLRTQYAKLAESIEKIGGDRSSRSYFTSEYTTSEPVTASDYLLRIEANRKAFHYYQTGPITYKDRLLELSHLALADLDVLAKNTFSSSSDDEIGIEILNYSTTYQGWVARATIPFGDKTLQFSFLMPFEPLTKRAFSDSVFQLWDKNLAINPTEQLSVKITYTLNGSPVGNNYTFTLRSLEVWGKNDRKNERFYKAQNLNPWTTTFAYGTSVDLSFSSSNTEMTQIVKKMASSVEAKQSDLGFFVVADAHAQAALDVKAMLSDSDYNRLSISIGAALDAGLTWDNGRTGLQKQIYGVGARVSQKLWNRMYVVYKDSDINYLEERIPHSGVGLTGFFLMPSDNTLNNFVGATFGFGKALKASVYYAEFGGSYIMKYNNLIHLKTDIDANILFGYGGFFIGLQAKVGAIILK